METVKLGEALKPQGILPSQRMGNREKTIRLEKEATMLSRQIPPTEKGAVSSILDTIAMRSLMPIVYKIGGRKLGSHLRSGFTNFLIKEETLDTNQIDSPLKGLKIAHLSDLHLDLKESFPSALKRFLKESKPKLDQCDLVVITGDFQDKYLAPIDKTLEGFKKILPEISPPILGVLGNHDRLELADALEKLPSNNGIRMLLNESLRLTTSKGKQIIIQGIDDPHYYKTHKIQRHNGQSHSDTLKILLAHSPDSYLEAHNKGIQIHLNGHTHGGQMRLPILGAVIKASKVPKRLLQGRWRHKTLIGHTSCGVGCSGLSIRLLCPPEITILTIK
jgi:predicted MPP superfamily phosphohydrolase